MNDHFALIDGPLVGKKGTLGENQGVEWFCMPNEEGRNRFYEYRLEKEGGRYVGTYVKTYTPVEMLEYWRSGTAPLSAMANRFLERAARNEARDQG